jgi:hypothetical protein
MNARKGASMNTCKQCHCKHQCAKEDNHTSWLSAEELTQRVPMPEGYSLEQLGREDIPELIRCLGEWHPPMRDGSMRRYLREDFYRGEVFLKGEPEKDCLVLVIRCGNDPAAVLGLECNPDDRTLYGSLGVIAPQHRGQKQANLAPLLLEAMGRGMKYGLIYYYATLQIPQVQRVAEMTGFQLVGIMPAFERISVAGIVKHTHEAIYAKVLADEVDILGVQADCLTPQTKALFEFVFGAEALSHP